MIAYLNLTPGQAFRLAGDGPVWVRVRGGYQAADGGPVHTPTTGLVRVLLVEVV